MTGITLAEYKEQFEIPDDFRHRSGEYSGIFMDSMQIQRDMQDGQGFMAPQNLLQLSPEALDELQIEMAGVYDDIDQWTERFEVNAAKGGGMYNHRFGIDYPDFSGALIIGNATEMRVDRANPPPGDYVDMVNEVVPAFKDGSAATIQQVIDIKPEYDRLAASLFEEGPSSLETHREAIQALPEFAEQQLLADLTEQLSEHASQPAVAEFLEQLEAAINGPEPESEASAPAPAWAIPTNG